MSSSGRALTNGKYSASEVDFIRGSVETARDKERNRMEESTIRKLTGKEIAYLLARLLNVDLVSSIRGGANEVVKKDDISVLEEELRQMYSGFTTGKDPIDADTAIYVLGQQLDKKWDPNCFTTTELRRVVDAIESAHPEGAPGSE